MSRKPSVDRTIRLSPELIDEVRQFRFARQIDTTAKTIRHLLMAGLRAEAVEAKQQAGQPKETAYG